MSSQSNADNLPKVEFEDIASGEGILNKDISEKFDKRKGIAFEPDNILFGKLRPYLKNWLYADFKGIALGDFWVFEAADTSPIFDYYLIQADKYQEVANLSTGTKMPRSDWKVVSETDFLIPPKIQEQTAIGKFFLTLDDTITLHKRKLDGLKKLKSGYLQVMFPQNGESVPKVRFKGFSGEWEVRKLGEVGKTQSGVGFPEKEQGGKDGVPFFKVSDMNLSGNENIMHASNNYVDVAQIKEKRWNVIKSVPAIIFAKVGAALLLDRKRLVFDLFLIDNNMMAYLFDKTWDVGFIKALFEIIDLPKYAQVGALPSFNGSDIEAIKIIRPTLPEQTSIGDFFRNLDEQITTQQRKLSQLKQLKSAYLQKMFI